jgi:hypothetical protein
MMRRDAYRMYRKWRKESQSRGKMRIPRSTVVITSLFAWTLGASPAQGQNKQETPSDAPVRVQEYAAPDARPEPPAGARIEAPEQAEIAQFAGVGSPLAYARSTVVELGGTLAFGHDSDTTTFRIAPSIGYFPIDNLEFTLFPQLRITHIEETDTSVGLFLEPSYHVPVSDVLFAFAGLGVGFRWADDPGFEFAFVPKLGLDIMIGRSGILKPATFLEVGLGDGAIAGGLEAGFTVMW